MEITNRIVSCNKFVAESGMFVIDACVNHCNVNACSRNTEVPSTHWVETGVAGFDCWSLNIAVENNVTVFFNHHHIIKCSKRRGQRRIDLAQEDSIHCFKNIDHIEAQVCQRSKMSIGYIGLIDQCCAGDTDSRFYRVVYFVPVLVQ